MNINIDCPEWTIDRLMDSVVSSLKKDVVKREHLYFVEIPEEGCYADYDKFKNQVAKEVAKLIYEDIKESKVIEIKIDSSIKNIEKILHDRANKQARILSL